MSNIQVVFIIGSFSFIYCYDFVCFRIINFIIFNDEIKEFFVIVISIVNNDYMFFVL